MSSATLSLRHRKFINRLLIGASAKAAYRHAFPEANANTARSNGPRLQRLPHIQAALTALREKAEATPGSEFLTYIEARQYFARVVRARAATLPEDSDLWNVRKSAKGGLHFRFPDKLRAITLDTKLSGLLSRNRPKTASPDDQALTDLLARARAGATPSPSSTSVADLEAIRTATGMRIRKEGGVADHHPVPEGPPRNQKTWPINDRG